MSSALIEIDLFREILVLPLRLRTPDSRGLWFDAERSPVLKEWVKAEHIAPKSWAYDPATFFADPDDPTAPIENKETFQKRWKFAEQAYFHPFVQRFLYDGEACQQFQRKDPRDKIYKDVPRILRVEARNGLSSSSSDSYVIDLLIDNIALTALPEPGLFVLTLEVYANQDTNIWRYSSKTKREKGVSGVRPEKASMTLADALSLHDCLRRVFPPFFNRLAERGKAADNPAAPRMMARYDNALFPIAVQFDPPADPVCTPAQDLQPLIDELQPGADLPYAAWWRKLFSPLLDGNDFVQVVDERIPTMVFVGLRSPKRIEENDLIRLCFADHPERGPQYNPHFMRNFMQDHAYTRFAHLDTTYYASSYSFVAVADTGGDLKTWSYGRDVAQEHFRRHYAKMFFIVQMQKAALLTFSCWLSDAVGKRLQANAYLEDIRRVRRQLVSFTHRFWFSNVSNQEQARELFALMQDHSGNPGLYTEVQAESTAAREELAINAAESQAENAMIFNVILTVMAALGLPLAFFGTKLGEDYKDQMCFVMALSLFLAAVMVFVLTQRHEIEGGGKRAAFWGFAVSGLCAFAGTAVLYFFCK